MHRGCVLLAAFLAILPIRPATADYKGTHASLCQPRGPGTTLAELNYGAYGVANPGDTDESLLCPLVADAESALTEGANHGQVYVRYRTGAVPGRISCTLFTGAYGYDNSNSGTYSATSPMQPANSAIAEMVLYITAPAGQTRAPVMSVVCVLGPKVMLGGLLVFEK